MNNAVGATNNNSFHPTRNQIPIISSGVEVDIESLISHQATENICTYLDLGSTTLRRLQSDG
jgi:hypothetical protein